MYCGAAAPDFPRRRFSLTSPTFRPRSKYAGISPHLWQSVNFTPVPISLSQPVHGTVASCCFHPDNNTVTPSYMWALFVWARNGRQQKEIIMQISKVMERRVLTESFKGKDFPFCKIFGWQYQRGINLIMLNVIFEVIVFSDVCMILRGVSNILHTPFIYMKKGKLLGMTFNRLHYSTTTLPTLTWIINIKKNHQFYQKARNDQVCESRIYRYNRFDCIRLYICT